MLEFLEENKFLSIFLFRRHLTDIAFYFLIHILLPSHIFQWIHGTIVIISHCIVDLFGCTSKTLEFSFFFSSTQFIILRVFLLYFLNGLEYGGRGEKWYREDTLYIPHCYFSIEFNCMRLLFIRYFFLLLWGW